MSLRTDQTESLPTFGNHAEDHRATNIQVNQNTDDIAVLQTEVVPPGGSANQVLAKLSGANHDLYWTDQTGGGGGAATYTNAAASTVAVGGIPIGTTFNAQTMAQVFDRMFYAYQYPAFTAFAISGQATSVEVGTPLSGTKTFTWSDINSSNITANTLVIKQDGSTLVSGQSINSPASVAITAITNTSPTTHTWTVLATDSHSDVFSRDFTVNWLWKVYTGTSALATLASGQIVALANSELASTGFDTYGFVTGNYKYICYPDSFPAANSFNDISTGFTVTMADSTDNAAYSHTANGYSYAIVSVTNGLSQTTNYKVYRTKYVLGGAINIKVS